MPRSRAVSPDVSFRFFSPAWRFASIATWHPECTATSARFGQGKLTLTARTSMIEEHGRSDDNGRRDFLKGSLLAGAAATVTTATMAPPAPQAQPGMVPGTL